MTTTQTYDIWADAPESAWAEYRAEQEADRAAMLDEMAARMAEDRGWDHLDRLAAAGYYAEDGAEVVEVFGVMAHRVDCTRPGGCDCEPF